MLTKNPTITRSKVQNSMVSSNSGAGGGGDRTTGSHLPFITDNPYFMQDYVNRWRAFIRMYETSWEARKIIRIVPEDALRKPWEAQDIPEEMALYVKSKLDNMQFLSTLKKSLMLERLLGGCLTFLGLDGEEDDLDKSFHPKDEIKLRFCNAIPVSRIARVDWCHDPLSEQYMRPEGYLINGQTVHVSRTLVWDGEPLFDPFDYALNNFRANLAGFGESKLAPIWDDIVKAVGTRQAAYQLIQTNNAIIMAVNDLADLQGTKTGKQAMKKLEEVANQISMYRAAMIDGEKVSISQQAASFGSVPELMMSYLQILSAASDIPATRFLGQAPGGLNATGDSDLENYYNVIDAYQQQRIVPNLRRVYDIILFEKFGEAWKKERHKLDIKFPPLWNESELEMAQRGTNTIDNTLKLIDAGLMGDKKAIQELNSKGVLSVKLDETDISTLEDVGFEGADPNEQVDAGEQIQKLRNSVQVTFENNNLTQLLKEYTKAENNFLDYQNESSAEERKTSIYEKKTKGLKSAVNAIDRKIQTIAHKMTDSEWNDTTKGSDFTRQDFINSVQTFDPQQIAMGIKEEQEHFSTVEGDEKEILQIVHDHLKEDPQYYSKLKKAGLIENAK